MLKMSVGIIIMGFGFLFMAFASNEADIFGKSQMYWLVLAYLFHTVGELCASPVALSFITKLSPRQFVASVMGIYFAAIGIGNKIAGSIGQYSEKLGEKDNFFKYYFSLHICWGNSNIFSKKIKQTCSWCG